LITWWVWGLTGLLSGAIMLNWLAAIFNWRKTFVFTKPLVLILLLTIFMILSKGDLQLLWFYLALGFSLAGDSLLLYPTRAFILGLVAFLFAQVAYIMGLNAILPPLIPTLLAALVVGLLVLMVFLVFQAEVRKKPDLKRMRPAILLYALMLSVMALSAVLNRFKPAWNPTAACLTAIGGILFLSSDLMLAYNRFVHQFRSSHILVMMTYHLAQLLLVLGVLIQYRLVR
jgi:uncharacterized membrane protein YhhN